MMFQLRSMISKRAKYGRERGRNETQSLFEYVRHPSGSRTAASGQTAYVPADLLKTAATADISETEAKARIGQVNTVLQEYNIC